MEVRELVDQLVHEANRNASVIDVVEQSDSYRVTIGGTTGVTAACEIPRDAMEAAARGQGRGDVTSMLKRCADETVAPLPDARG